MYKSMVLGRPAPAVCFLQEDCVLFKYVFLELQWHSASQAKWYLFLKNRIWANFENMELADVQNSLKNGMYFQTVLN